MSIEHEGNNDAIGANKQEHWHRKDSTAKPTDNWRAVQIVFFLHGVAALLPWNMLINADTYFVDYKLNPTVQSLTRLECNSWQNESLSVNQTELCPLESDSTLVSTNSTSTALANYRANFLPYLSTASKLPNIIFQLVNLMFSPSYQASSSRLVFSFVVEIGLFMLTIWLALIDSSAWPETFFWVTMATAVLFNTVNGIFQSCVYGIGAKFPMHYTNYITLGFSFSGTIASLFLISSLLLSPHPKVVAIYYFAFATIFMVVCLVNELIVRSNNFLRYNVQQNESESSPVTTRTMCSYQNPLSVSESDLVKSELSCTVSVIEAKAGSKWTVYGFVMRKCWMQLLNIVLIYLVSFAIFPAVQAGIRPLNTLLPDKFFVPVFCFLFFNTFATVGNYVAERIRWPSPTTLVVCVWARAVFVPFFLLCNYLPGVRVWPVLVHHDLTYALGSAAMAFTSGYLSALAMMYVPRCVPHTLSSTAAMMASASVIIGILAGVQCSIVLRHLVTD